MKKSEEIIGLPVIDLSSGNKLGKVWGIIINGDKGSVDYFIVDDGLMLLGTKIVDAKDVKGIGEYALTVERKESIKDLIRTEQAVNLYKKNVKVKGTQVLTREGRLIGKIGDIYINERDCSISLLEFRFMNDEKTIRIIPRKGVITFGESLVVVVENIEELFDNMSQSNNKASKNMEAIASGSDDAVEFLNKFERHNEELTYKEPAQSKSVDITRAPAKHVESKNIAKKEPVKEVPSERNFIGDNTGNTDTGLNSRVEKDEHAATVQADLADAAGDIENYYVDEKENKANNEEVFEEGIAAKNVYYKPEIKQYQNQMKHSHKNNKQQTPKSAELFELKQREFLLGRKVTKPINDKMGNSILNSGDEITEEAMDRAKETGRFIELVMNNRP